MIRRVALAVLLLAGCSAIIGLQRTHATAPITPRPLLYLVADAEHEADRLPMTITRVSDAEESEAGERLAREYSLDSRGYSSGDGAQIAVYLNQVGSTVANHVHRQGISYYFYLRDDANYVNAFALPGGHVVVGRGLFAFMKSEDELAAVLGHEIAHVDDRHAIERLQYELASRKLGLEDVYRLGSMPVVVFEAGYTKEQELEADRVGLEFAVEAGYSPGGVVKLMERFEKIEAECRGRSPASPIEEVAGLPSGAIREYFRSHPPAEERLAAAERYIRERGWNEAAAVRPLAIPSSVVGDSDEISRSPR